MQGSNGFGMVATGKAEQLPNDLSGLEVSFGDLLIYTCVAVIVEARLVEHTQDFLH